MCRRIIMGMLLLIITTQGYTVYAGEWPDRPDWKDNADRSTVVLQVQRFKGEAPIDFCSGAFVRDSDGKAVYTAGHCCSPFIGQSIQVMDYKGTVYKTDKIRMDMLHDGGMDVCRIPIRAWVPAYVKPGKIREYWREPGSSANTDPRLFMSTHFPRYCNAYHQFNDIPVATNWCFQPIVLITELEDDRTRTLFHVLEGGVGPGTSGSPIFNVDGEIVGVQSIGWSYPSMHTMGGFSPLEPRSGGCR